MVDIEKNLTIYSDLVTCGQFDDELYDLVSWLKSIQKPCTTEDINGYILTSMSFPNNRKSYSEMMHNIFSKFRVANEIASKVFGMEFVKGLPEVSENMDIQAIFDILEIDRFPAKLMGVSSRTFSALEYISTDKSLEFFGNESVKEYIFVGNDIQTHIVEILLKQAMLNKHLAIQISEICDLSSFPKNDVLNAICQLRNLNMDMIFVENMYRKNNPILYIHKNVFTNIPRNMQLLDTVVGKWFSKILNALDLSDQQKAHVQKGFIADGRSIITCNIAALRTLSIPYHIILHIINDYISVHSTIPTAPITDTYTQPSINVEELIVSIDEVFVTMLRQLFHDKREDFLLNEIRKWETAGRNRMFNINDYGRLTDASIKETILSYLQCNTVCNAIIDSLKD